LGSKLVIFTFALIFFTLFSLAPPIASEQTIQNFPTFYPAGDGTTSIKAQFFYCLNPKVDEQCYSLEVNSLVMSADGTPYIFENVLEVYWGPHWNPFEGRMVNSSVALWKFREYTAEGKGIMMWGTGLPSNVADALINDFGKNGNSFDCVELGFGSGGLGGQPDGVWINVVDDLKIIYSNYSPDGARPKVTNLMDTQAIVTGCNTQTSGFPSFPSVNFTQAKFIVTVIAPVNLYVMNAASFVQTTFDQETSNLAETPLTGYPCQNICYYSHIADNI
jgi:hypothetical protein